MVNSPSSIHIPERTVERRALPHGGALLYAPNPYNQIVALRVLSPLGSKHESAEHAGLANLAMRMLTTGTSGMDEDEIALRLERNGAHFKAEPGKDSSAVDLLTTTHFLRDDLETLLLVLDEAIFPEDKLEREREIARMNILEEDDSPLNFAMRHFTEFYYGAHPYAWPSLGKIETLDAIGRDAVAECWRRAFDPAGLVVSVVGGAGDETLELVERAFSARAGRQSAPLQDTLRAEPAFSENVDRFVTRDIESEYLVMGYPGCGLTGAEAPALRVIAAILGGSMDSRLFREIRDKRGLCYQVGAMFSPRYEHTPLLTYVVTTPPNRVEAVRCIEAEVERLKSEPVDDEELNRAKTYICGSYLMSMETNMGQASRLAAYELAGLGWDYINRFTAGIQAVSPDDIMSAARRLFTHRLLTGAAPQA
ncbi:MAG: hypothetical protein GC154_12320 [bacterium]|nr:hypothetical protein [bacterium]